MGFQLIRCDYSLHFSIFNREDREDDLVADGYKE